MLVWATEPVSLLQAFSISANVQSVSRFLNPCAVAASAGGISGEPVFLCSGPALPFSGAPLFSDCLLRAQRFLTSLAVPPSGQLHILPNLVPSPSSFVPLPGSFPLPASDLLSCLSRAVCVLPGGPRSPSTFCPGVLMAPSSPGHFCSSPRSQASLPIPRGLLDPHAIFPARSRAPHRHSHHPDSSLFGK